MNRLLDLNQLRAAIASAPADGNAATVTRRFLEQVVSEISQGRAAEARLQASRCMDDIIHGIANGARA